MAGVVGAVADMLCMDRNAVHEHLHLCRIKEDLSATQQGLGNRAPISSLLQYTDVKDERVLHGRPA